MAYLFEVLSVDFDNHSLYYVCIETSKVKRTLIETDLNATLIQKQLQKTKCVVSLEPVIPVDVSVCEFVP